jgi:glycosyltransferase involved in cell wall biosynthesis
MSAGTPILTVDRGGVAERVAATGGGTRYPFNDRAGLTAAAIDLFRGDLRAIGMAGRRAAERHHGWDAAFVKLFDVYRRLAAAPA